MKAGGYIRRAAISDLPYLYEICLKTGNMGKSESGMFHDPYLIGHYYAAPYLVWPEGICYVYEARFCPRGYVVCAPDTKRFYRWLENVWLPPLRGRYPVPFPAGKAKSKKEILMINRLRRAFCPAEEKTPYLDECPAKLHINLLAGFRRRGIGSDLMNRLFAELARSEIKGVHLGTGRRNKRALAFYKKMGFAVIQEDRESVFLGKPL